MNHLAVRSEYSFNNAYAKISSIVDLPGNAIGIADDNNTFGHCQFEKAMLKAGKKPVFGVRLTVFLDMLDRFSTRWGIVLLAKNNSGLKEIYRLTSIAWEQFYYEPRLSLDDFHLISGNIIIISNIPYYTEYRYVNFFNDVSKTESNGVYIDDNNYIKLEDRDTYQLLVGSTKRGDNRNYSFKNEIHPQHVLGENEVRAYFGQDCIDNTYTIADLCCASIEKAEMVRFNSPLDIRTICTQGSKNHLLHSVEYSERFEYEINLINSKGYADYFMIVSDMIRFAKKNNIFVGPARGSSAGSLVCYMMDITEIDPIKHGLLFERFIDINRNDLPDIDIDFPDDKRTQVIKYLISKYGENNVCALANINTFQAKSAIGEFAACLGIPRYETEAVKGAIVIRSSGDARAGNKIEDTFNDTEAGKSFIKKYPAMQLVAKVEGHAHNASKHAAGIIVSNKDLTNYASIDRKNNVLMIDKKDCWHIDLLKIDVLGLRTLSIIADTCKNIDMSLTELYSLPLDNANAYTLFANMRLNGIFQFDGPALRNIVKQIGAREFNDLALITALSRPGTLNSGGTGRYIEYKKGNHAPEYRSELHKQITEESLGVVVYQEQMMQIARLIGRLPWNDVSALRQASSKSYGDEYFNKYKDKFIQGAIEGGETPLDAEAYWADIRTAGSWLFNKSHAVSYGLVSYWTAYLKANFPLEFAVANLNHCIDDDAGVKLLRDFVENENIKYVALDPDKSDVKWTVQDNILVGGLINLPGVKEKTAQKIINDRKTGKITPAIRKKLSNPVTQYDDLFPCKTLFSEIYPNPLSYDLPRALNFIRDVAGKGLYIIMGKVISSDVRDRNDYQSLVRRNGTRIVGNSLYLRLIIEDDTDSVICLIGHGDYQRLEGARLVEELEEGTYVLIQGAITSDWRAIAINKITILR